MEAKMNDTLTLRNDYLFKLLLGSEEGMSQKLVTFGTFPTSLKLSLYTVMT